MHTRVVVSGELHEQTGGLARLGADLHEVLGLEKLEDWMDDVGPECEHARIMEAPRLGVQGIRGPGRGAQDDGDGGCHGGDGRRNEPERGAFCRLCFHVLVLKLKGDDGDRVVGQVSDDGYESRTRPRCEPSQEQAHGQHRRHMVRINVEERKGNGRDGDAPPRGAEGTLEHAAKEDLLAHRGHDRE